MSDGLRALPSAPSLKRETNRRKERKETWKGWGLNKKNFLLRGHLWDPVIYVYSALYLFFLLLLLHFFLLDPITCQPKPPPPPRSFFSSPPTLFPQSRDAFIPGHFNKVPWLKKSYRTPVVPYRAGLNNYCNLARTRFQRYVFWLRVLANFFCQFEA